MHHHQIFQIPFLNTFKIVNILTEAIKVRKSKPITTVVIKIIVIPQKNLGVFSLFVLVSKINNKIKIIKKTLIKILLASEYRDKIPLYSQIKISNIFPNGSLPKNGIFSNHGAQEYGSSLRLRLSAIESAIFAYPLVDGGFENVGWVGVGVGWVGVGVGGGAGGWVFGKLPPAEKVFDEKVLELEVIAVWL